MSVCYFLIYREERGLVITGLFFLVFWSYISNIRLNENVRNGKSKGKNITYSFFI